MHATLNISLSAPLSKWVEEQVAQKGYRTASDYISEVLRREREKNARMQMDRRLSGAIGSGRSTPLIEADWNRIRAEGRKLARKRATR